MIRTAVCCGICGVSAPEAAMYSPPAYPGVWLCRDAGACTVRWRERS
jgi:hypothetical protein